MKKHWEKLAEDLGDRLELQRQRLVEEAERKAVLYLEFLIEQGEYARVNRILANQTERNRTGIWA